MTQYLYNMFFAIDQFASTVLGGDPDDTISERLGRAYLAKPGPVVKAAKWTVDLLALTLVGQKNHCISSLDGKSGVKELWNWGGVRTPKIE